MFSVNCSEANDPHYLSVFKLVVSMEDIFSFSWIVLEVLYLLAVAFTVIRAVADTRNSTKTVAYVLAILFLPVIGMIIYYSFGLNYRKKKLYSRKLIKDRRSAEEVAERIAHYNQLVLDSDLLPKGYEQVARYHGSSSPLALTSGNKVQILKNGERKFPRMFEAMEKAQHHIHLEYYIYEDDEVGNELADLLIRKAEEGVEVRFIYDDFGSHGIRRKLVKRMKKAGVKAEPFYRVRFYTLANSLNYRNHRKIAVIDGGTAYIGGINISDRYINGHGRAPNQLYWRDTHLEIEGTGAHALQYIFMADWNFVSGEELSPNPKYFPRPVPDTVEPEVVKVVASGPDSQFPTILYSILSAIHSARKSLWITTPYFVPTESLLDALIVASHSGVDVRLLTPGVSDSSFVKAASRSYYSELLRAGVKIYEYQKGFVHAKTMVVDDAVAIVGTANMDLRSFDLNFEVNAILFGRESVEILRRDFEEDLKESLRIDAEKWMNRKRYITIYERFVRLVSPLL